MAERITTDREAAALLTVGRKLGRDRHQDGWVEEVGTRIKKWRGHYYIYERNADGDDVRRHKTITLGAKARMRKGDAQEILDAIGIKVMVTLSA